MSEKMALQQDEFRWLPVATIDRAFGLGTDEGSQRVGCRKLVSALLDQLRELRQGDGPSQELQLRARLGVCRVPEEVPFASLALTIPLGHDKAGHRLGLREMVAQVRVKLDAHSTDGGGQELSLDAHTVIEKKAASK